MSVRKPNVALKAAARRDIRDILLYTGEQWGTDQREIYRQEINRALTALSHSPRIGRPRDDINPGLRSYRVQQHIIYYRLIADIVTVLRILHERMDVAQHL